MNDYVEVRLDLSPMPGSDATDLLAAVLGDVGFESFVPDESGLTAYIPVAAWNEAAFDEAVADFPFECEISRQVKVIEGRDWNEEWERNYFQPIVVGDLCVVHSSFHTDIPKAAYDIVIDPKMAFGTGHHATTSLILDRLLSMDLDGSSVIDMGTGTGILAILAAMRGARPVTAIEIDPFAHVNAVENVAINGHDEIKVILGDASALEDVAPARVFIANINRNVITADIAAYASRLEKGGTMLLSGFYNDDVPIVEAAAEAVGLRSEGFTERDRWACLKLVKI
ncbi:MAG: 50S ribosomal protein L11 methyltransferase [Muribaculaceae bacterium]|nr:50S ribosomal protein L11 methyltransferase [Muribaculaceae bacterium]MCI9053608.1 50S ribosomal protein L11 methyltransferase [Muribaculaceae bacterium]